MTRTTLSLAILLSFGSAQAQLLLRDLNGDGEVDAYFDPSQGISLVADANLPATLGTDGGGFPTPGSMPLNYAQTWVESLDLFGATGWRLPEVTSFSCETTSCLPKESELSKLQTFAPFQNVEGTYWLGSTVPNPSGEVWNGGYYTLFNLPHTNSYTNEGSLLNVFVWAVRDGDVGGQAARTTSIISPAPEPGVWLLFLTGLLPLLNLRRHT